MVTEVRGLAFARGVLSVDGRETQLQMVDGEECDNKEEVSSGLGRASLERSGVTSETEIAPSASQRAQMTNADHTLS